MSPGVKYSIGTNQDDALLETFARLNALHQDKIAGVFAAVPVGAVGTARDPSRVGAFSFEILKAHFERAKAAGLEVNYLFNSAVPSRDGAKTVEEIARVASEIRPDIVTAANDYFLGLLERHFPRLPLCVSIVRGVKDPDEVRRLAERYNVKRIIPHQSIARDWRALPRVARAAADAGVELELLANEMCQFDCPIMDDHYQALSAASQQGRKPTDRHENYCNRARKEDPLDFINGTWIRPEDVALYEDMGIRRLKLAGRDKPSAYLARAAAAYLGRRHEGNVMDLFSPTWWPDNAPPRVDNRRLDGLVAAMRLKGITHFADGSEVPERNRIAY